MSGNTSLTEDPERMGLITTALQIYNSEGGGGGGGGGGVVAEIRHKRIGSGVGFNASLFAITVGLIICTTFVTARPRGPRQSDGISAQIMQNVTTTITEEEKQQLQLQVLGLRESPAVLSKPCKNGSGNGNGNGRRLSGPGSHPPSCKSKCGKCAPCKPVHVPIHPGRNRPSEYYPEAWRCKCDNKLYMP